MSTSRGEFGVSFEIPGERLEDHYRISHGMKVLGPEEAESAGFRPVPSLLEGVPVPLLHDTDPMLSLRQPNATELEAITATNETQRIMRIVHLGRAAVTDLKWRCLVANGLPDELEHYQELVPGILGIPRDIRKDQPGQVNVSMSSMYPDKKVGDHIDEWPSSETSFVIANLGPGVRWHRIVPELNRDAIGSPKRKDLAATIADHPNPDTIPVHWFKLNAPQDEYVEAAIYSPVGWASHEGSTIGSSLTSLAIMAITRPEWQLEARRQDA